VTSSSQVKPRTSAVSASLQTRWTAWNHVRTVAPLASATLLTIALRVS
jgi:uncharacterized membrane protein